MQLDVRALALAGAVIWAGLVLFAGLAHLVWPAYASAFWQMVASIYPGVRTEGVGSVILATIYAIVDGGVCGSVIAWIYNAAAVGGPVA
jgi:uncharacterized RDD family membrane protein YckC